MRDKKFKYFITSKRRKIRYSQVNAKKKLIVIFFHGFMSDMEGKKAARIPMMATTTRSSIRVKAR